MVEQVQGLGEQRVVPSEIRVALPIRILILSASKVESRPGHLTCESINCMHESILSTISPKLASSTKRLAPGALSRRVAVSR